VFCKLEQEDPMRVNRSSLVFVLTLGLMLTAVALPPVASAQGVYVCVSSKDGVMRYLGTAPGACLKNETLVSLLLQGPVGPEGPQGPPGPSVDLGPLTQRVADVENTRAHFGTVVHCGVDGETVAKALEQAAVYASAEIGIDGVCPEIVSIGTPNTTLYGVHEGRVDGLILPRGPEGTLVNVGATGVTLHNLTLSGAGFGLWVGLGSRVSVFDTTIQDNMGHAVMVSGTLSLTNSTVTGAGNVGVGGSPGAVVVLQSSSVVDNAGTGLSLGGARGLVHFNSHIERNGSNGILLYGGSSVSIIESSISNNTGFGLVVAGGSSAEITPGTVVNGNTWDGIIVHDVSVLRLLGDPSSQTQVMNNGRWGVFCDPSPAVAQIAEATSGVVVTGNTLGQVSCPGWPF
jgi:hypothetical protein